MGWWQLIEPLSCWVSSPEEFYKNRDLFPGAPRGFGGSKDCYHRTGAVAVRKFAMYTHVTTDNN